MNISISDPLGLLNGDYVQAIENRIQDILQTSSQGQLGAVFDSSGAADFTVDMQNGSPETSTVYGETHQGASEGSVYPNRAEYWYVPAWGFSAALNVIGTAAAHEFGHGFGADPKLFGDIGNTPPNIMGLDNAVGTTGATALASPLSANVLFTSQQVGSLLAKCNKNHPNGNGAAGGGGSPGPKGTGGNPGGQFWLGAAWFNWWVFGSNVPRE